MPQANPTAGWRSRLSAATVALIALLAVAPPSPAAEYVLAVQPILSPEQTRRSFEPLAEYLTRTTGHTIRLATSVNFVAYWQSMKAGQYDFVLDAAHFTDYRLAHMRYAVLAKVPATVSYSLVVSEQSPVLDAAELVGRPFANTGSPSLGAMLLDQLFPNPLRQPAVRDVDDTTQAIRMVREGKVLGTLVPTPLVGAHPDLITVLATDPLPHIAVSAAPSVPADVQRAVRDTLLRTRDTPEGRAMLAAANLPGFEEASAESYAGYERLLRNVWGY
jgi:ABC-type phosphate/phosphonate transport system substrate-binding protein